MYVSARAEQIHAQLIQSPFSPTIDHYRPPRGFTSPKFKKYEPTSDAYVHLVHFRQMMSLYVTEDELLCKVFPSSL